MYTYYYPEPAPGDAPAVRLSRSVTPSAAHPIHDSIRRLDHEAMEVLTLPPANAVEVHTQFTEYLTKTMNTICGRHPIGVLLGALAELGRKNTEFKPTVKWVRYDQSNPVEGIRDSSVSYASAWIRF
jgi:predicted class III extradiol MEMO1 family dioxygenase